MSQIRHHQIFSVQLLWVMVGQLEGPTHDSGKTPGQVVMPSDI